MELGQCNYLLWKHQTNSGNVTIQKPKWMLKYVRSNQSTYICNRNSNVLSLKSQCTAVSTFRTVDCQIDLLVLSNCRPLNK